MSSIELVHISYIAAYYLHHAADGMRLLHLAALVWFRNPNLASL